MPNAKPFEYTFKYWDNTRPVDLPKTGLGEALRKYETAKADFVRTKQMRAYASVKTTFLGVEDARKKAISKCGLPHFKPLKRVLEGADPAVELDDSFKTILTKIVDEMVKEAKEVETKLVRRKQTVQGWIDDINTGKAPEAMMKAAKQLANTEGDGVVLSVSDIGNAVEFRNLKSKLAKDFPQLVKKFDDDVERKMNEVQNKSTEYRDTLTNLGKVIEALEKAKKAGQKPTAPKS
jgi:hypothetical protein